MGGGQKIRIDGKWKKEVVEGGRWEIKVAFDKLQWNASSAMRQ